MGGLFDDLPAFPVALPDAELQMLRRLPQWDTVEEIGELDEAIVRRLEGRGLVKIQRHKADPIAIRPTMFAGRLRELGPQPGGD